jgi:hypothetical protein
MSLNISGRVESIEYNPLLCSDLEKYDLEDVLTGGAFDDGAFILSTDSGDIGMSWWVTPKRTRSYPFTRVYDTMDMSKRVTVIPIVKEEGAGGDRDYMKWSTVSLMSLLGVYVIPAYYADAEKNEKYDDKITNQVFDYEYIVNKIEEFLEYQSDALHWNIKQMENLDEIADVCEEKYYEEISPKTGVEMSSRSHLRERLKKMTRSVEEFKKTSKQQSKEAQQREFLTDQPKEEAVYDKGKVTIENFLGGVYHFTADEAMILEDTVVLIEKKHSRGVMPSEGDIKDGLLKLILFSNLEEVKTQEETYDVRAGIGMTGKDFPTSCLSRSEIPTDIKNMYQDRLSDVFDEAEENDLICFASSSDVTHEEERELVRSSL